MSSASRQKPFFDQDQSKANQKRTGNRNYNRSIGQRTTSDPLPKATAAPKIAIKASTQTRSKLEPSPEKENQTSDVFAKSRSPEKESLNRTPKMSQSKTFPSTPAMRLPLADLVGNAEEALRRHDDPKDQSPEERIGWIANSSHPDLTPRQKRRRAQSSSPLSSSQERTSDSFAFKDSLIPRNLQQTLKTPRTISDPIAELWSRYATGRNPDDPDAKLPSIAHLIEPSSPRSGPRTPGGGVAGLRRWASCGMDFPASKAKRRKTHRVYKDGSDSNDNPDLDHQKPVSRVGMLLEAVQASLAQPAHLRVDAPSSSSPLPEKGDFLNVADVSPLLTRTNLGLPSRQSSQIERHSQLSACSFQSHGSQESETDEFGDDDLDMDIVEAVQAAPLEEQNRRQQQPTQHQYPTPHQPSSSMATIDEDSDEYNDGSEICLEDLESAVTLFDSTSASRPQSAANSAPQDVFASTKQTNYTTGPIQQHSTNMAEVARPRSDFIPIQQQVAVDLTGFSDDNNNDDDDDDDDEFGGSDLDDDAFAQAEFSATQAAQQASGATSNSSNLRKSRAIQRYLVKQVIEGEYTDAKGRCMPEKVLVVEDETEKRAKAITLRNSWFDTHCTAGSYVHVVGSFFASTGQITIDDANNLLIVHPDHLISATVVADSFECIRRAVLQDRVKATSTANEYNVYGTILHEIFQDALKANRWESEWLDQLAETTLSKFLEKLFEIGHDGTGKALEHLRSKMPELKSWAEAYVKARPGSDALADDRNGKKVRMSVTKLLDVEEHVWSPTYGLKGNIDATVQVNMQDEQGERSLTVPFEVKTGRNTSNTSHRAQTALYTLLLSDRYDLDVIYGILYYMETSAVSRIPAIRNELRQMIMQRNELASYVRERLQLPPMLQNPHKCGRCYAKTQCFLYHKLAEGGTAESAGVKDKFDELVGKLQPAHQEFFQKWDDLLTKEESEMMKFRRELWTMLSKEREKLGRCFSEVVIEPGSGRENQDGAKINRFSYSFVKKDLAPGFSFTESQITVGEPVVVSSEQGHFALANGYVTKVSKRRVSVAVDRRLHNARRKMKGFDSQTNQTFVGIMEVEKEDFVSQEDGGEVQTYRLDKDEFSNGMSTVRNNLLSIMDDNVYRSFELRSLIVENRSPAFKAEPSKYTMPPGQMNPDQHAAIDKVMSAQDYALVLGMPGTGKTTTIAQIIRALVARGKSVLLTSYTHTAVDNILLKLRSPDGQKQEISILRLGTQSKIHPEVQDFATLAATAKHSLEEIQDAYMTPQVVATTCLGISHFLFQKRVFDYCIVDEASQITLPVCLGPIRMARTFVLVGDHYQLPPLVQNKDAQEGGLDVSLFKLLSDAHPEAVVELGRQYRMCEDVMLLSNTLIYNGKLQCGNQDVAKRTLSLPNFPQGLDRYHGTSCSGNNGSAIPCAAGLDYDSPDKCWLKNLLDPNRKAVFANTDSLLPNPPRDSVNGPRITNTTEAQLVAQLVFALLACGVPATEIGVITFYRSQLALLRQTVRAYGAGATAAAATGSRVDLTSDASAVEMHTCDKFQGRDKEVVIVSCVRSNESGNVGDLLKDWRRINVACTRARSKLVLVGSAGTLAADSLLGNLLKLMGDKGWVVKLPGHAELDHEFEVAGTATGTAWVGMSSMPTPGRKRLGDADVDAENAATTKKVKTLRKGIDEFLLKKENKGKDLEGVKMLSPAFARGKENRDPDDVFFTDTRDGETGEEEMEMEMIDIENLMLTTTTTDATKMKRKREQQQQQDGKQRQKQKPFKIPRKTAVAGTESRAMTSKMRRVLDKDGGSGGSRSQGGNAVLRDIVNDALGDDFVL